MCVFVYTCIPIDCGLFESIFPRKNQAIKREKGPDAKHDSSTSATYKSGEDCQQ